MDKLFYRDAKFIYKGKKGEQILLDLSSGLNNKSKISIHRLRDQKHRIIYDLLTMLIEWEQENGDILNIPAVSLIDVLLTNQLMKTSQPVRLLEYGSGQGKLSWHLAELLGAFHEKSTLICAYDTIDSVWMERISQVDQLPELSFFAGDFGHLYLQENFFDIVVINGMVNYTEPYQVISDALRLAKDDAVILCYTNDTPLLESSFCLFFEQREEYEISHFSKVMLAKTKDRCWNGHKGVDLIAQALEHIEQSKAICLSKEIEKHVCFSMLDILKQDIKNSIEIGDIDLKLQLLEQKEQLLQYTLNQ